MIDNSIAVQLRADYSAFSPTERKVARVLLQQYPLSGLETVAQLAQKAAVSGPTVLRLVAKLGFDGYSAFQQALRTELDAQLQSPLLRREPNLGLHGHEFLHSFADNIQKLLAQTARQLLPEDFDAAVTGANVIIMLRLQKERMEAGEVADEADYFERFGLDATRLARASRDAVVMHPGPMNRDIEIASDVADGPQSAVLDQVANGVFVRMAVLNELIGVR